MHKPAISVVIPCYNAKKFLSATLAALRAQSFTNWEAIVNDDGSTDNSSDIAWGLSQADKRISVSWQTNWGVSFSRNRGAELAKADIVAFLDADDIWHPNFLKEMFAFMQAKPERIVGFARARFVTLEGSPTGAESRSKLKDLSTADFLAGNPTTTCSNLVVRRDAFLKSGGFKKDLNHAEDQLWLLQMHLNGHLIEGLDNILLDYRANNAGLSSDVEAMRRGWDEMVMTVQSMYPDAITPALPRARARNLLYLAKRAMRTGQGLPTALSYVRASLKADWPTLPLAISAAIQARI
jgi:glycosyltransferase involved in cell wall biosynthesis